jgi:hypothetical protein
MAPLRCIRIVSFVTLALLTYSPEAASVECTPALYGKIEGCYYPPFVKGCHWVGRGRNRLYVCPDPNPPRPKEPEDYPELVPYQPGVQPECKPGWTGPSCGQRVCPSGLRGPNCDEIIVN